MATRDWASLGFTPTLNFALPNERQLAQSSLADAGKGAEFKFNPTAMNQQLLASLGYTGQGLTTMPASDYGFDPSPVWSDDARTWLANNGYTVGVAHDPNTSPGGRPEYYGLVDANGQFVAGQDEPTMTMSDTTFDQIAPFALMAAPFAAQAMFGGGLGGGLGGAAAGEAAAAGAGATAGGAAGGAAAGGMSAADFATLFDSLSAAGAGASAGAGAAGAGAAGAAGAGMTAADFATLFGSMPGYIEGTVAAAGLGGAAGSALGSAEKAALYGAEGYGAGMTGAQTAAYDAALGLTGSKTIADVVANSSLGSSLVNGGKSVIDAISSVASPISSAVGGGSNLAALVGAGLGAASGGGTQTSSRDPWGPSQDFLKAVLGDAGSALTNLRQQPYTPQQQTQYSNAYAGLDQARSALPGLLNWSQGAMQRQSTTPSMAQLFGGGLLQQPTAQAGGGLVDDRMQALMARGRGLIG